MGDLYLKAGESLAVVVRWENGDNIVYKPISAITKAGPVRITTSEAHGLQDGWKASVTGTNGMNELRAVNPNAIKDSERHPVTVVDATHVEFNDVNSSEFKAYVSGGFLQYNAPMALTGWSVRNQIRTRKGAELKLICTTDGTSGTTRPTAVGTDGYVTWAATTAAVTKDWTASTAYSLNDVVDACILHSMTTENGLIVLDDATKTITLYYDAPDFTGLPWKKGYQEVEIYKDVLRGAVTKEEVHKLDEGFVYLGIENTK